MKKRMVIMLLSVGLLLGGLVGFNEVKGYMMKKYMGSAPIPPATVTASKADYQEWQPQISAVGTLRAVRGVDVTTEVPGLVSSVEFKSGDEVKAGQVLLQLNADTDVAQLHALEASADLAKTTYERDKEQLAAEVISKAQVDNDAADLKNKRALVAQQAALVEKKTIRAPFAGKLGISTVNPGQYITAGTAIVTLQTVDPVYVDFNVPQLQIPQMRLGQKVTLTADAYGGTTFEGKVNAINPRVDTSTRNVQVEATIANPRRLLVPGMFATVKLDTGEPQRLLTLPQTAIAYNPYGSTVFVVKAADKSEGQKQGALVALQTFVTPGPTRGDQVAILKGVQPGDEVVTSGQGKLKNGMPVVIDNKVQPADNPNPAPQEH
ncbi:MAG TPA: efflux RND transporter periplasmic adaptor subunit [Burkholderiales bacterium]|nr:efflux RND transporter periplasmic adaptor subunit [Burkholderiales bacterium]